MRNCDTCDKPFVPTTLGQGPCEVCALAEELEELDDETQEEEARRERLIDTEANKLDDTIVTLEDDDNKPSRATVVLALRACVEALHDHVGTD